MGNRALSDDLAALAADAYVYGFPLVSDLQHVRRLAGRGVGRILSASFNRFSHAPRLAGPRNRFVSINNDTIYSIAQVDLSGGPVLLRVPDAGGRYYVLQFVDAWTNNFAYVGRRATGTAARSFLLTPPMWRGHAPAGAAIIEFPTMVGTIVGRWACDGPGDLYAVRALQCRLSLTPSGIPRGIRRGIPVPTAVPARLAFFEQLRTWMRTFPPSEADRAYQQRFGPLGLLCPTSPYADQRPGLAAALTAGAVAAKQKIKTPLTAVGLAPVVNGWALAFHMFDYNLDHLGLGTIDDAAWKIHDRQAGYLARALAARGGLWGNHGYEAAYAVTYTDANGEQLDGRRRYTLKLTRDPPVDAFWSITMYDVPDFYLIANPIGRYSIGDRTPGLHRGSDGSLTIVIQHAPPADTSNWLPAPAAPFRPVMRLYQPQAAVFDGSYRIPAITKAAT